MSDPSEQSLLGQVILIIVLTIVNAFLAGAEMAFVSVSRIKLDELNQDGKKAAGRVLHLLEDSDAFLSTIQVGITIAGFLSSASASQAFVDKLMPFLQGVPGASTIATLIVTLALAYFTLVFGELYPKQLALQIPEQYAMFASGPIQLIKVIFKPFVWLLTASTGLLKKLTPIEFSADAEKLTRTEMQAIIKNSRQDGVIDLEEFRMMEGVLSLDTKLAREIMVPRTDTLMLDIEDSAEENIQILLGSQYSRVPVYEEDKDNIIGVLHLKDVFIANQTTPLSEIEIRDVMNPPFIVPETVFVDDLLIEFKKTHHHMAILKDEYGGTVGIVTLEDLIEEIVGEIEDEYDEISHLYRMINPNTYIINGSMPIDKFNQIFETEIETDESDTIAGYMIEILGFFPDDRSEEVIRVGHWELTTSAVDNGRIRGIAVNRLADSAITEQED